MQRKDQKSTAQANQVLLATTSQVTHTHPRLHPFHGLCMPTQAHTYSINHIPVISFLSPSDTCLAGCLGGYFIDPHCGCIYRREESAGAIQRFHSLLTTLTRHHFSRMFVCVRTRLPYVCVFARVVCMFVCALQRAYEDKLRVPYESNIRDDWLTGTHTRTRANPSHHTHIHTYTTNTRTHAHTSNLCPSPHTHTATH